ncbi:IclR family transcriptional regulator [Streptomyces bambusae]|uniref:IclR family transcriptional regulator n=1 Tax=Streptomyces bambusae TaxID=1550616 RepID=UPI001CFD281D|nr:IclR family transcriptional regulator [Streptomyces bambusae]MCB5165437.1 IclR family transcriptional regulator [Streptomyces bambusae]
MAAEQQESARPAPRGGRTSTAGTALEKSLRILEAVAAPGGPHRLTDIARAAAVPKSSTHRILTALAGQGYVRSADEVRYAAGPRLRTLAAEVSAGEPAGIGQVLGRLRQATGQTVHLALHSGETVTYIRKLEDHARPFRTASRTGMRMPLHTTAIGKCVLAGLPAAEADALLDAAGLPGRTPASLTTREALRADLDAVRSRGWALDDEENEPGIRCIGAAVLDPSGRPVGGVSVTTVTFLVPRQELESYAPALREAAAALAPLL